MKTNANKRPTLGSERILQITMSSYLICILTFVFCLNKELFVLIICNWMFGGLKRADIHNVLMGSLRMCFPWELCTCTIWKPKIINFISPIAFLNYCLKQSCNIKMFLSPVTLNEIANGEEIIKSTININYLHVTFCYFPFPWNFISLRG